MKTTHHLIRGLALALSLIGGGFATVCAASTEAQVAEISVAQALRGDVRGDASARKAIAVVGAHDDATKTTLLTVNADWLRANPEPAIALVRERVAAQALRDAVPDARLAARVKAQVSASEAETLNALFAPQVVRAALVADSLAISPQAYARN